MTVWWYSLLVTALAAIALGGLAIAACTLIIAPEATSAATPPPALDFSSILFVIPILGCLVMLPVGLFALEYLIEKYYSWRHPETKLLDYYYGGAARIWSLSEYLRMRDNQRYFLRDRFAGFWERIEA